MNASDLALEASRAAIALGLAVWIGGTLLAAGSAPRIFAAIPSRAKAGALFGEILGFLDRAKFIAAGGLLVGVLLEVQTAGSALPPRHVVRAGILFVLVASHVFSVMVVQPKMRYLREKIVDLDAAAAKPERPSSASPPDDPWRKKFDEEHRRATRVTGFGLVLAVAALLVE